MKFYADDTKRDELEKINKLPMVYEADGAETLNGDPPTALLFIRAHHHQ